MIRLMFETGHARRRGGRARSSTTSTCAEGLATVRRGKGGKGRVVPFGPDAALALDRYLRLRRGHRLADRPDLWLGDRGKRFSYDALHKTLGDARRRRPASTASTRTGCGTPPPTAGSPPAAPRAG